MSILVYVDTNTYIDCAEDRKTLFGKPLGPRALKFFMRAARCEFDILISRKVRTELLGNRKDDEMAMLAALIEKKLRPVDILQEDVVASKKLDEKNSADALHALTAKRHGAKYLVTSNKDHFLPFAHIIQPVYPDEI
jgi:predicted nucleic acid-binding protein